MDKRYFDFPELLDRESVSAELNARIYWFDQVEPRDFYDDTKEYIECLFWGMLDYDGYAVRYHETGPMSDAYVQLDKMRIDTFRKRNELCMKPYFADSYDEYIGCKACGSVISRPHLLKSTRPNFCPVCGSDLRPKSVLDEIARADAYFNQLDQQLEAENQKIRDSGTIRWLVQVEP